MKQETVGTRDWRKSDEPTNGMRKTDSDWKGSRQTSSEISRDLLLPKNNSDNKLNITAPNPPQSRPSRTREGLPPSAANSLMYKDPSSGGFKEGAGQSLYEKTLEKMNHKNLYTKTIESKKGGWPNKQEGLGQPPASSHQPTTSGLSGLLSNLVPAKETSSMSGGGRNSAKKPTQSYLLNESLERGKSTRKDPTDPFYNNYLAQAAANPGPSAVEKRLGNLIRKPKGDFADINRTTNVGSNLRNNIAKRIKSEDAELSLDLGRGGPREPARYGSGSSQQRDYSLEMYKKQMSRDKRSMEYDPDGLDPNKPNKDRSGSRSMSRKPIDVSNDRIKVPSMLDYYKDQ